MGSLLTLKWAQKSDQKSDQKSFKMSKVTLFEDIFSVTQLNPEVSKRMQLDGFNPIKHELKGEKLHTLEWRSMNCLSTQLYIIRIALNYYLRYNTAINTNDIPFMFHFLSN
jgi:hypothetical protein